jgi:hypothetical protein
VLQRKTWRPVQFEIMAPAREAAVVRNEALLNDHEEFLELLEAKPTKAIRLAFIYIGCDSHAPIRAYLRRAFTRGCPWRRQAGVGRWTAAKGRSISIGEFGPSGAAFLDPLGLHLGRTASNDHRIALVNYRTIERQPDLGNP